MSEVGNRALLRALANYLQILDQRRSPDQLDVDRIVPVVDLTRIGDGDYTVQASTSTLAIGGGTGGSIVVATMGTGRDGRVQGMDIVLDGAADLNIGNDIFLRVSLTGVGQESHTIDIIFLPQWAETKAAAYSARFTLHGFQCSRDDNAGFEPMAPSWRGWMPEGSNLEIEVFRAVNNFPAGSQITHSTFITTVEKGRTPPF